MRQFKIFFVCLLSVSFAFAQPRNRKEEKSTLKIAKEHLRYEEYQQAMPYVADLLEQDPQSAYYNFWMGKCMYISYKKNQALKYFEKVEKINPDVDREFYYWYGLTLHYNLYFDRAIAAYRQDLERYEPSSAEYIWVNNRISQCLYAKKVAKQKDAEQVKIENMGDRINSEFSEHSPVISANDSVLIYTARRPECLGAEPEAFFYDEDIYISYNRNGEWTEGVNIGRPVNATGHDATISVTADGQKLFIYRHKKAGGLYVTEFDEQGKNWKEPRPIKKPLNSKFYEASICQSADSSVMFFTSDRPGGYGGRDIYMVERKNNNEWTEPVNLGPAVNTPFDEDAPYFHPDGKTLYYSSNGPNSIGGFDIFVTEIDSTSETGWMEPLNMGSPVNTPDDDIYFVLSGSGMSGYYSSGMEGGYGEKDIYNIKFPYYPYPRRYHVLEVAGLVQDVQTLDTLNAWVKLVDVNTRQVLDSVYTGLDSAKYYFMLEPERTYSLEVVADGYYPSTEELTTPSLGEEDVLLEKNMFLDRPVEVAETPSPDPVPAPAPPPALIEIQHIYYDFDQDYIRQDATVELDRLAAMLKKNEDLHVKVLSHTDWFGTYTYNVDLSNRRAKNAIAYLHTRHGISLDRLEQDFFSENVPIETNGDDRGRQFNRRTEFRVYMKGEEILSSVKLRTGVETIEVDHTTPKGEPGYDNPEGLVLAASSPSAGGHDEDEPRQGGKVSINNGNDDSAKLNIDNSGAGEGKLAVAGSDEPAETAEAASDETEIGVGLAEAVNTLDLRHIYFDFDKYNLRADTRDQLQNVVSFLERFPDVKIEIYGHTDAFGSVDYNQRLSENRAQSTYQYLLANGASNDQLVMLGASELKPIDTNDTNSGRQNNRRVEFRLIYQGQVLIESRP